MNSDNACEIKVQNIDQNYEGIIEVQLGFSSLKRDVKLFKPVDHIDVNLHVADEDTSDNVVNVKSDGSVSVTCVASGGYPKPKATFVLVKDDTEVQGDFSKVEEVVQEDSEDIKFSTTLTPTPENQGYFVSCKLEQVNHLKELLEDPKTKKVKICKSTKENLLTSFRVLTV